MIKSPSRIKRNCTNCRHLDVEMWENGYGSDSWAYVCNRPSDQTAKREDEHLKQLERETYREKAKRCHEPNKNLDLKREITDI